MTSLQKALAYAQANRDQHTAGFHEFLSIPSISTDPAFQQELERCGSWVIAEMERLGFKNCHKIETAGHPVLYGEWLEAGEDKPTILIYAHYDVQPVDPLDLWVTPPFEPTVRDDKLFARGVIDDKCGVWANLKALESILAAEDGQLPVNVKLFFEGEEEMGSPNMLPFVQAHKELLAADLLVICDGPLNPDSPRLGYALRGIVAAEVTITGPDHDLHSGAYGGAVHNPLHMVGKIVGSFHDDNGRIQIPGYYDRVKALDASEKASMDKAWEKVGGRIKEGAGTEHFWGEAMASLPERLTALPTLDVNGIWGGYQGPGVKTVIPSQAGFKATMRLVADQNPHEIGQMFKQYVERFACDTADIQVKILVEAWPFTMEFDGPAIAAVQKMYHAILGQEALLTRGGGSVPIGGMFQHELGLPITSIGLGSGDNVHSPNEYMHTADFGVAIDLMIHFYYNIAETMG